MKEKERRGEVSDATFEEFERLIRSIAGVEVPWKPGAKELLTPCCPYKQFEKRGKRKAEQDR